MINEKIAVGVPRKTYMVPEQPRIQEITWQLKGFYDRVERLNGYGKHEAATNKIIKQAIDNDFDWLIKIDTDMLPPDVGYILDMLGSGCDLIYPVQMMNGNQIPVPVVFKMTGPHHYKVLPPPWKDWQEADAVGSGMFCVRVDALKKIPHPWFELLFADEYGTEQLGADLKFCEKARQVGVQPMVYTVCSAGHVKNTELHLLSQQIQEILEKERGK